MNQKLETIVEDICSLAPELKEKEDEVRKLVQVLIETKPKVVVDAAFVEDLRTKLQGSIRAQKAEREMVGGELSESFIQKTMKIFNTKIAYSFAAVMLVVLVALPFVTPGTSMNNSSLALAPQVKDSTSKMAFGDLSSYPQGVAEGEIATEMVEEASFDSMEDDPLVDYDDAAPNVAVMMVDGMGGGREESSAATVGAPVPTLYEEEEKMMVMPYYGYRQPVYDFDGEIPDIDEEGYVYKRIQSMSASGLNSLLKGLNVGMVDIASFSGTEIKRLELVSKGDPSYTINIDLERGEISINRVWSEEEMIPRYEENPPQSYDVDTMIGVANKFLATHKIDVSSYGEPEVNVNGVFYAQTEIAGMVASSELSIMPDPTYSVSVMYPLVINGMKVVGQSGEPIGISVSVSTHQKFVENVWGLESQNYERSLYTLMQDKDKILDIVKSGGHTNMYYGYYEKDGKIKTVVVDVEDPEIVLMKYWTYEQGKASQELLIPAIMFDIDRTAWQKQDVYVQDAIVVPLVEDIIKNTWDRPLPMPAIEGRGESTTVRAPSVESVMMEVDAMESEVLE